MRSADIERDYAKRLTKLAKTSLGKYETGYVCRPANPSPMRHALDTVRIETDAQARSHIQLENSIRREVEGPLIDFMRRVDSLRRDAQTSVTKLYKHKHTQTQYMNRAREKYETDCAKINSYTAQSNMVQGRELDKVMAKLERVQANIDSEDRDYQSYVRALQETTQKWNSEYKSFLDICQDVEEERQDFLKTNVWGLANAISSVCVTDDEACERVRVALEGCEASRDVREFVREFATGSMIPPAPEYINYAQNIAQPPLANTGTAHFSRLSTRVGEGMHPPSASLLATQTPATSNYGTPQTMRPMTPSLMPGSVPGSTLRPASPSVHPGTPLTPASMAMQSPQGPNVPNALAAMNRGSPMQAISPSMRTPPPSTSNRNSMFAPGAKPLAQSQTPRSQQSPVVPPGMLPPASQSASRPTSRPTSHIDPPPPSTDGDEDDPIAKALANLRMRQSRKSPAPSSRPTSTVSTNTQAPAATPAPAPVHETQPKRPQSQSMMDPRWQQSVSPEPRLQRPISPAAAFMNPPPERNTSPLPFEQIHSHYSQAFPSERRIGGGNAPPQQQQAQQPRATTPLGISLDAQGHVVQDTMAGKYGGGASERASGPSASAATAAPSTSQLARPPTGQYSENGEPILFYVKALYDYEASLPEEFSFTAGDIIAVTHTEPDGWWQGELLDESRRTPGANTFPSNFVVLLM